MPTASAGGELVAKDYVRDKGLSQSKETLHCRRISL